MPKVKTNSAAKKRFTFTGTGKIKRRHILTKKSKKRKRNLGKMSIVDNANMPIVKKLLVK